MSQSPQRGAGQRDLLLGLTPEQRAIFLCWHIADRNLTLAGAAAVVSVITSRHLALFQDFGYRGCAGMPVARNIRLTLGIVLWKLLLVRTTKDYADTY
jgi:hypothetical protein